MQVMMQSLYLTNAATIKYMYWVIGSACGIMDAVGKYTREEGRGVGLETIRRADGEREKVRDR